MAGIIELIHGDCLEEMPKIESGSVDLILTDPPYGTTDCKWDSIIPFDLMWEQLNRVIKPAAAIILTTSQPFTSMVLMSNIKMFRHEWIYQKRCASNFSQAKNAPMKEHESILIFGKKRVNYYPIKEKRKGSGSERVSYKFTKESRHRSGKSINFVNGEFSENADNLRYPSSIQMFNNRAAGQRGSHPTQKPVALMEYLIKTYTNEGETVLDFTMGSGSTGVAAHNLNRNFIGIEKEREYFDIAEMRMAEETAQIAMEI